MTRRAIWIAGVLSAAALTLVSGFGSASARPVSCPDSNLPNEIVLAGGSGQTAQLGQPFETNFQVKLANRNGCPITGNLAGINITFDAPDSGPSGIFAGSGSREATVGTDSNGFATAPTFTANFTAGGYTVFAHSAYGDIQFSLINTASGLAAEISAASGSGQSATVATQYPLPLQAYVLDANGQPVQGATVSFSVVPGSTGASATFLTGVQTTAVTNSAGVATSPPLLANSTPGRFTASAAVGGVATVATFALDNHAAAEHLTAAKGATFTATVNNAFHSPLSVTLRDASGQPIEGETIAFTLAPQDAGTPGATFSDGTTQTTEVTNMNGVAVSPRLIADRTAGTFVATAAALGAPAVRFVLHNKAGRPAALAIGSATGESTSVSTRFVVPLVVTVTDRYGNAVTGAIVTFVAPRRGAGGHFVVVRTRGTFRVHAKALTVSVNANAHGVAVAPAFFANGVVGGYLIRVAVKGGAARGSFALVNTP